MGGEDEKEREKHDSPCNTTRLDGYCWEGGDHMNLPAPRLSLNYIMLHRGVVSEPHCLETVVC